MRYLLHILSLALAFDYASCLSLQKRERPAVLSLDIERKHVENPIERDRLRRRSKTVEQTLDNEETLYFCNITLGTPKQSLRLTIDTGSSDLWCNSPNSQLCSRRNACRASGTYDANSSSTYQYVSSNFRISYVDGSQAAGDYVKDTLSIGGVTIEDFQFGVGYTSTSSEGVLGIGYPINEALVLRYRVAPYANLPRAMVENGLINTMAYSLWLNDLDANTGLILFGGVNTGKFHGKLHTLPIIPRNGTYSQFDIALTGFTVTSSGQTKTYNNSGSFPAAALLDSGSSLTYLPDPVVEGLYADLDVTYIPSSGIGVVPCDLAREDIRMNFTFSEPTISVPMDEMVLDVGAGTLEDGTPACILGISPAGDGSVVLGDTFLRSAYVVYDLENNEISLAQTRFNSSDDNILEITKGSSGVPSATEVEDAVTSVVDAAEGGPRIGGPTGTGSLPSASTDLAARAVPTMNLMQYAAGAAGAGLLLAL